ncbi:mitochondrial 37S ribosomal protein YmS16 [Saccharomycopsis crataegensis]|uniref:Mitochondrial 37S ribosomal protein YmS16 n=1 Tax=Saccharomycopsis crataegensis TaxID=43959 RepID=A0AAV5QDN8_9ASCO|nr:mitochondrial 37S ribosomal protein YmS16 [Saccharomycopsis crataegensis]
MLYELLAIARTQTHIHSKAVHEDAKAVSNTLGKLIINNRGIVRRVVSLGPRYLPKLIKKDQQRHFQGSYFTMLFDASPVTQRELGKILKSDPRIIRSYIYKVPTDKNLNAKLSIDQANEIMTKN